MKKETNNPPDSASPIGKIGRILNGSPAERYVLIQDDRDDTGGYLILTGPDPDFTEGYDGWVEEAGLNRYLREAGWRIEWPD